MEKEETIVEKNLNYYKVTQRVSKKELELRKKVGSGTKGNRSMTIERTKIPCAWNPIMTSSY